MKTPRAPALLLFAGFVAAFVAVGLPGPHAQSSAAVASGPSLAPIKGASVEHMPFELEDCASCHAASEGDVPGPIKDDSDKACFECHDGIEAQLTGAVSEHAGFANCVDCHNPHNANHEYLLHRPVRALCLDCHEDTAAQIKSATVQHGAITDDNACISCHSPHASERESLLRADVKSLCLACHAQEGRKGHDGKVLANVGKLLERPVRHKPIEEKGCAACHAPHGGEHRRLLRAPYPADFYGPWSKASYGLCFGCHEAALVEAKVTRTATSFRDGDKNLHALHVDRGQRGRSCRACHEMHASTNERLVADDVPFGSHGWRLPVGFTKTDTGGGCAKTCHMVRRYDRGR